MVDDVHRAEGAALAEHHGGPCGVVDGEVIDVDRFATERSHDRRSEPIGSDPAEVGDGVSQASQPDRDVRFGAGDVADETSRLGQRPRITVATNAARHSPRVTTSVARRAPMPAIMNDRLALRAIESSCSNRALLRRPDGRRDTRP